MCSFDVRTIFPPPRKATHPLFLYPDQLSTYRDSKLIMSGSKIVVDSALRAAVSLRSSKIPSELAKSSAALFSAYGGTKQTLPDLPYDYGALERESVKLMIGSAWCFVLIAAKIHTCIFPALSPRLLSGILSACRLDFFRIIPSSPAAISAETMTLHHTKHHNTYVTNLNAGLEKLDAAMSAGDVSGIIALQGALKFNGGGHINHTLFWENLSPDKSAPAGDLASAIDASFGGFDAMKAELSAKTIAVQGSGWGWLAYNASTGELATQNLSMS